MVYIIYYILAYLVYISLLLNCYLRQGRGVIYNQL